MGSGISTNKDIYKVSSLSSPSPSSSSSFPSFPLDYLQQQQQEKEQEKEIKESKEFASLITPQNIKRIKRGSFHIPKISSQYFTSEMIGNYILQLSTWNEGYGYDDEQFMNHMKFINYKQKFIEHEIDGTTILTLKNQQHFNQLLDDIEIFDEKHRSIIIIAFNELQQYLLQSIHVIKYEDFISFKEFPRCPDNDDIILDLTSIDLSKSFIIFISHCWLRGYSGAEGYSRRPHPDNIKNEKYQLCIDGIKKIVQNLTDNKLDCYIWMDYSCINQDLNPAGELQHLDEIVKYSDCMFTPIVDNTTWEYIHTNEGDFYDYKASGWCQGEHSYIHRAWCRVEMFYAANVPLSKHVKTKLNSFSFGLKTALENQRRPHFLYGTREKRLSLNPIQLLPLCKEYAFFNKYHPCKGSVSVSSDILKIQQLVDELKPYLSHKLPTNTIFPSPLITSNHIPPNIKNQQLKSIIQNNNNGNNNNNPNNPNNNNAPHTPTNKQNNSNKLPSPFSSPSIISLRKNPSSPGSPVRCSSPIITERSSPLFKSPNSSSSPQIITTLEFNTSPSNVINNNKDNNNLNCINKSKSNVTQFELENNSSIISNNNNNDNNNNNNNKSNLKKKDDEIDNEDYLSECNSDQDDNDELSDVEESDLKELSESYCFITQQSKDSIKQSPSIQNNNMNYNSNKNIKLTPLTSNITNITSTNVIIESSNNNNNNNNNKIPHITSFTRKTKDINGCIYHGEYKGYDRHGNGQLLYPNGDIFEGIFKKNVIHGKGKYTYGNGDVFIGKWKNGYRHGKGVYTVSDGEIIDEMYQNGHKIKGKFIFPNYIYIGSFDRDGKKQGHGIIRYTCGEVYEGGFVNDHREGNGKFIYSNGDIYEGNFHENFRHGKGKYIGHKGDVFTGEYKYDKKDCENGTYITITGDVLNGTWKNNIKHGKFKIKYTNGDTYVGDYKYDKKHGRGTYTYSNTESYTGEYRNGMKHGQGTYRFKNGQEKRGLWYDDILTENSLSGGSSSHGITRGISMKSVLSEQNEKEQKESDNYNNNKNHNNSNKDFDDNDTIISNLSKSYRELFHDPSNHLNKGITKNTNSSISPYRQSSPNINRNRSGSDGSERSVTVIARQSPLRSSNGKQQTRERYTSPKLSQIRN